MNEGIITNRYTKAFFQVGEEEGKTETIRKDIEAILLIIKESEEFSEFLASPIIKGSIKEKLLVDIFSGRVDDITLTFLNLLTKNKREQYLASVCHQYLQFYKDKQGIKEAIITTAHPLSESHRKEIHAYLKKKLKIKIDLIENIDVSLIGGFKLRIEDRQIDASIISKLKNIETELINS